MLTTSIQRLTVTVLILLSVSFVSHAQNKGNNAFGERQRSQLMVAPPALITVDGTVTAVNIGFAAGLPTMEMSTWQNGTLLVLVAPPWYLQAKLFSLNVNDDIQASVFVDPADSSRYVAAVITNLKSGQRLVLRDAAGLPLWSSRGSGPRTFHTVQVNSALQPGPEAGGTGAQQGMCTGNECPMIDLTTLKTLSGLVSEIEIAPGQLHPNVKLKLDSGEEAEFHLGPYWYLETIQFSINFGDRVTVLAALCPKEPGDYVVFQMTNDSNTFVFRQSDGMPLWKSGMCSKVH